MKNMEKRTMAETIAEAMAQDTLASQKEEQTEQITGVIAFLFDQRTRLLSEIRQHRETAKALRRLTEYPG
jgi:hypothetical protein